MEQHYQENMIEGAMFLLDRKKKIRGDSRGHRDIMIYRSHKAGVMIISSCSGWSIVFYGNALSLRSLTRQKWHSLVRMHCQQKLDIFNMKSQKFM